MIFSPTFNFLPFKIFDEKVRESFPQSALDLSWNIWHGVANSHLQGVPEKTFLQNFSAELPKMPRFAQICPD